jgi:rhamnosyltransferase
MIALDRPQQPPLLSVVIRNRNEGLYLERVLAGLRAQEVSFPWELVLVDNESDDNSCAIGSENGAKVITIGRGDFSYGRALNLGIAGSRGKYILSLSAHALPVGSYFLENCVTPFREPEMAAARCLSTADAQNLLDWYQPRTIHYSSPGEQRQAEAGREWLKSYPTAACCVLRRSVWEVIKFDETLEANEDKEWASRVLAAGHKIVNSAECVFHYMKPLDEMALLKKQQRESLALYRIRGERPLTWKWFVIRMGQAFFEVPGVAYRHVKHKFMKNYFLVTLPSRAKTPPDRGSLQEFESKRDVRN